MYLRLVKKYKLSLFLISSLLLTGCINPQPDNKCIPSEVYIGIEVNSHEEKRKARKFIRKFYRKFTEENIFHVDLIKNGRVHTIYSNKLDDLKAVQFILDKIKEVKPENKKKNKDKGIIQSFLRIKNLAINNNNNSNFYTYIITKGTSNSSSINEMNFIVKELVESKVNTENIYISLVGLTAKNRLPMVNTLQHIKNTAKSSGESSREFVQILDNHKACKIVNETNNL
ncbi:MAG: hypothetical protein AAF915_23610 [Cyanobacteria bacterium P01_D01_bin.50]